MIVSTSPPDLMVRLSLHENGGMVAKLLHEKGAAIYRRSFADPSSFKLPTLLQWVKELSPSSSGELPVIVCHDGENTFMIKEEDDISRALTLVKSRREVLLSVTVPNNDTEVPQPSHPAKRSWPKPFLESRSQVAQAGSLPTHQQTHVGTPQEAGKAAGTALCREGSPVELTKGDKVQYYRKFKKGKPFHKTVHARVVKVHTDEIPYYYTIRIDDGDGDVSEVQTERSRLTKVAATASEEVPAKPAPTAPAAPAHTPGPKFTPTAPYEHRRRSRRFARSQTAAPRVSVRGPSLWVPHPRI